MPDRLAPELDAGIVLGQRPVAEAERPLTAEVGVEAGRGGVEVLHARSVAAGPGGVKGPAYAPPMPSSTVWVGGQRVDDASISPLDHGYLVGDGVFETLKTIDGTPFALTRHLARLRRSAAGLDLLVPDDATIRAAIDEVLARRGGRDSGGCASRCRAAPGRSARDGATNPRRSSSPTPKRRRGRRPPASPPCRGPATSAARPRV